MTGPGARSRRRRRGQALVEFAIVAPVFFLLVFGIIEAGRFIFYYEILNNATREGARYAIVHGANNSRLGICDSGPRSDGHDSCDPAGDNVKLRVGRAAFGMLGNAVAVDPQWHPNNDRNSTVTVAASYTYSVLVPLVPLPPITIHAESTLVVNN